MKPSKRVEIKLLCCAICNASISRKHGVIYKLVEAEGVVCPYCVGESQGIFKVKEVRFKED